MSDIVLTSAVRNNLLSLQNTAKLMDQTQHRLSTGKSVNSALDNPTNFFTAASLDSRAGDLNRLLDSIGNAVQTLEAADQGMSAITDLVEAAQASARQALQASGPTLDQSASQTTDDLSTLDATGGTITINGENVVLAANDGEAEAVAALQAAADAAGTFTVIDNGDNTFTIEAVGDEDLVIGGDATTLTELGLTDETIEATFENNTTRENAEQDFNQLLTQINELAADASFNGVNLINGDDLTVIFNEDGSSSLTIEGVTFDSAGLGINEAATDAFQSNANIEATLAELDAAINDLRAQAATFGSNLSVVETRENFTNNLVNVLQTGAANLTLADTNEESANLLALQTRQQLSTVSLSMASQADQNVLRLF